MIGAVDSIKDGDAAQGEKLRKIEILLQATTLTTVENESKYLVRPLRLVDAPMAPNSVPRPLEMTSIERHLLPQIPDEQQIVVLSGPGGIGKSQLARQYAVKYQRDYASIFWVDGRSEQSIRRSIAQMSELIPLPQVLDSSQKLGLNEGDIARALQAVQTWLTSDGNTGWLIIIDEVDSQMIADEREEDSEKAGGYDMCPYIPTVSQGSLIITSRLSLLAGELGALHVPIQEMQLVEGLELLQKASGRPYNDEGWLADAVIILCLLIDAGAEELVRKLGAYPLALMQAAKYIYEIRCNTSAYLDKYERDLAVLINRRSGKREYRNGTINVALQLSWDTLQDRRPDAAAFLLLCGFLDCKDIVWQAFNKAYRFDDHIGETYDFAWRLSLDKIHKFPAERLKPSWLVDIAREESKFDDVVRILHELSFVRHNEESDGFSIHEVIHDWIVWMCDPSTESDALSVAADIVAWNYGSASDIKSELIKQHADRCVKLSFASGSFKTWNFSALYLIGALYYDQGEVELTERLMLCAMEKLYAKFGYDRCLLDLWTARTLVILIRSRPIDATIQQLEEIELRYAECSSKRSNRLFDLRNQLCFAYQVQGDFIKAIHIGEAVVESIRGNDRLVIHSSCAVGLLAESYLTQGKYELAKHCAIIAINEHEREFGADVKDGSVSAWRRRNMIILAIACSHLEQLEQAEVLLVSVLADAVQYGDADDLLVVHAKRNLDCFHRFQEWQAQLQTRRQDIAEEEDKEKEEGKEKKEKEEGGAHHALSGDETVTEKTDPRKELSTDIHIPYLRLNLAMPLFETIGLIAAMMKDEKSTPAPNEPAVALPPLLFNYGASSSDSHK